MARQLRLEYEGAIYHVTARGNERKTIYKSQRDYVRFKEYLTLAMERFGCIIHAYVLMGNHYHLILETPEGNLSRVMHYLNGSYATYVNAKMKRSGHLWQGRYKSIIVDRDSYLLELSRYLHLNPVRAGMVDHPAGYRHSSYRHYASGAADEIVSAETIWGQLAKENTVARARYREFVEKACDQEANNPLAAAYGGLVLGGERFVRATLARLSGEHLTDEEIGFRKDLQLRISKRQVLENLARHFQLSTEQLTELQGQQRKWTIYLLKHYLGATSREVGETLGGMSCSAVAKNYQRFARQVAADSVLKDEVEGLWRKLSNVQV